MNLHLLEKINYIPVAKNILSFNKNLAKNSVIVLKVYHSIIWIWTILFQSPQNNVTAKFFDYCVNIVCWTNRSFLQAVMLYLL